MITEKLFLRGGGERFTFHICIHIYYFIHYFTKMNLFSDNMDLKLDHTIKTMITTNKTFKLSALLKKHPEYLTITNSKDLLILAVRTNDISLVKKIISLLPNIAELNLVYLIWDVVATSRLSLAELLLESKINVNAVSRSNTTMLHYAIKLKSTVIVKKLLKLGANLNAENDWGKTPLHEAAIIGNYEILSLLLNNGANPFLFDKSKRNILHHLCRSVEPRNEAILNLILNTNICMDQKDFYGNTALHMSISTDKLKYIKILVARGANIQLVNELGNTPLNVAIIHQNEKILKFLLENHAKTNRINDLGYLPMHIAYNSNNNICTKMLIKANANLYEDGISKTPFFFLCDRWNENVYIIIREMIKHVQAKKFVSTLDLEYIRFSDKTREYFIEVEKEMKKLRNTYLFNNIHNKSLANILVSSTEENAILFRYKNYRKEFKELMSLNRNGIYYDDLEGKYLEAFDFRLNLLEKETMLTPILMYYFPQIIIDKIAFETVSKERRLTA